MEETRDDQVESSASPTVWKRRRVLVCVLAVIASAAAMRLAAPWILPVWIEEGPLVQQADQKSARVVWFTSRAGECGLEYERGGVFVPAELRQDGHHFVATLTGLSAGTTVEYRIIGEGRTVFEGALRTAVPPGEPFHFVVFGDSGKGTKAQFTLAARMNALDPDFVVHTGDLVYSGGERYRYKGRFFEPYAPLLARVSFWPSLGNHDVSEPDFGSPYREVFELPANGPQGGTPENDYWFDYADARFVVIDSNVQEETLRERVAPWLEQVLSDAPPWRFVVFHHPPFTWGSHKPRGEVQRTLVPVLEAGGVDVVFSGHDHLYERTHPLLGGSVVEPGRGVVYIISGAGGARLYEALPTEQRGPELAVLNNAVHSFTHIRIDGRTLHLRQIDVNGKTLDEWQYEKPAAAAAAP